MKQYLFKPLFAKAFLSLFCMLVCPDFPGWSQTAPAPLFRDPVTDGAADPVVVWNRQEQSWWMLYTQRRAHSETADVAYCHGCAIGVATSEDHGLTWVYRGVLKLDFEKGHNTFWAPDVVYIDGVYHLYVSYLQGVRNHWGGEAHILHYTSRDLWDWQFTGIVPLSSDRVIDATLIQMPGGIWRMWYKDEKQGSHTLSAESRDLTHWRIKAMPAIGDRAQEGAKVFYWKGYYWMITDEWHGMRVYRSDDAERWERQGLIVDQPSDRPDDRPSGAHGDVIVLGEKAYLFYFTHPGRKSHTEAPLDENGVLPYALRRSSIQVAPLVMEGGTLKCDRTCDFDFYLDAIE